MFEYRIKLFMYQSFWYLLGIYASYRYAIYSTLTYLFIVLSIPKSWLIFYRKEFTIEKQFTLQVSHYWLKLCPLFHDRVKHLNSEKDWYLSCIKKNGGKKIRKKCATIDNLYLIIWHPLWLCKCMYLSSIHLWL